MQSVSSASSEVRVTAKIRFKRQYKPTGFGDAPDPRTVDGRRLSAMRASETRRLNRIRQDHEVLEPWWGSWFVRFSAFLARGFARMNFRS
jgi:hypothetical protein